MLGETENAPRLLTYIIISTFDEPENPEYPENPVQPVSEASGKQVARKPETLNHKPNFPRTKQPNNQQPFPNPCICAILILIQCIGQF